MSHRFWDYDNVLQHASASPEDISSLANRLYDEKLMEWFRAGRHDEILRAAPEYRAECSPEGRFSHYLMMAGAIGGEDGTGEASSSDVTKPRWNRTGDFLFRPALRRGASGRAGAGGQERTEMKLVHGIHAMLVTPFTAGLQAQRRRVAQGGAMGAR